MLYMYCLPMSHVLAIIVSENCSSFFKYESMGANDPQDMAILDPRGMVGEIYEGDHY